MKEYECKMCGTEIYLPEEEREQPHCPQCRGAMKLMGENKKVKNVKKYKCPDVKKEFWMLNNEFPYKCPFSNYTFSKSPHIKQDERL